VFEFLKYIHRSDYCRLAYQMPKALLSFSVKVDQIIGYSNMESEQMDIAYQRLLASNG
jgi:hypothetical protein